MPDFVVQFGIAADRDLLHKWEGDGGEGPIKDDPYVAGRPKLFPRGGVSFAGSGPNTRGTQIFIGLRDAVVDGSDAHVAQIGTVSAMIHSSVYCNISHMFYCLR